MILDIILASARPPASLPASLLDKRQKQFLSKEKNKTASPITSNRNDRLIPNKDAPR